MKHEFTFLHYVKRYYQVLILIILYLIQPSISYPQGDLLIMPKRVVFEGGKRTENLNLANIGKDTATYIISFVQVKMNEDGSFTSISDSVSGQSFADKNLRIFPRTVVLPPNEAQTVRVQVTNLSSLHPGEYRSHLYFRAIQNTKPLGEQKASSDSAIAIKLVPTFGISIPAIIRLGELSASTSFIGSSFVTEHDTVPILQTTLTREGEKSVYGDIAVDHISAIGKTIRVADVKGLAVYTPLQHRKIRIKLNRHAGADFSSGKLRITYSEQSPKNTILAQSEIEL